MTFKSFLPALALGLAFCASAAAQDLKINDLEYYETRGVNLLVYSNLFTGGFNDEKNSGIELIHHGVRTAQGGAVRPIRGREKQEAPPPKSHGERGAVQAEKSEIFAKRRV